MKIQLLFYTTFLFSFLANAQSASNDLVKRQLRGKVKSVTELSYEVVEKFGDPEKGPLTKKDVRDYNSAGYQTQHHLEDLTKDGEKTIKSFRYQDKTKLVEIKEENAGKTKLTKIEYNPQGKIGTVDFTDSQDKLLQRQIYRYDAMGLLTQIDVYNGDGSFYSKSVYTYNAKKQLVRKESHNEAGKLYDLKTYAYDNNDNLVLETDLNFWEKTTDTISRTYKYNEKKQKIEESYSSSNSNSDKTFDDNTSESFEYNEQGDIVSKWYLWQGEKIAYTYDKYNNWIKAVKTEAFNLMIPGMAFKPKQEIIERQIRYY